MAKLLAYTKTGNAFYNLLDQSMHLAIAKDGEEFQPLKNDTGILFPKATFDEGNLKGTSKTLVSPWLFQKQDDTFGVCCIRRNEDGADSKNIGSIMFFDTVDFIHYSEPYFLFVGEKEVLSTRCIWSEDKGTYLLEWSTKEGIFSAETKYFKGIHHMRTIGKFSLDTADIRLPNSNVGNVIEITEELATKLLNEFGEIKHVATLPIELEINAGELPVPLPKAVCVYSDGSTHEKFVDWDMDDVALSDDGIYTIKGKILQKRYDFPFIDEPMSDPFVKYHDGKYYLSSSSSNHVDFRISQSIEGLKSAEKKTVYTLPSKKLDNMWAQELHFIKGIPYVFTTVGTKDWFTVRCHILRCNGDIANPDDWEAPRLVVKPNGEELNPDGISLDMTYFCVEGVHYVMWSNRVVHDLKRWEKEPFCEPADIYIATIDPDRPWQLTTNPVCIIRPVYGWDRLQTEVDEGPYCLKHGDDIFVTISGSSTAQPELYCLGLLHAKKNANLLSPDGWEWLGYPVLTKESVKGQYGPGHNNFVKEPKTEDDLMIYHAVPMDENGKYLGRRMAIRRIHWKSNGYPYFEMTPERDVSPKLDIATMRLKVKR